MKDSVKKRLEICGSFVCLAALLIFMFFLQKETGQEVLANSKTVTPPVTQPPGGTKPEQTEHFPGGNFHEKEMDSVWFRLFGLELPKLAKKQGTYCILIEKKGGALAEVFEEQIYRRLDVTVDGTGLDETCVLRICKNRSYSGVPMVEEENIPEELKNVPQNREPKTEDEDTLRSLVISEKKGKTTFSFELNSVYETEVSEDEEYVYITLKRPYEVYDRIIVLDAGHGGIDPGTSGGGTTEAAVNLKVITYLKELMDERDDIKVYYTRLDDSLPDLSTRVEYANAIHADFLISVHCNYNVSRAANGIEVMYSRLQVVDESFSSRILALKCLKYVSEETGMYQRDISERSDNLHLMKYCTMPCALVEFGFMSNRSDLAVLKTDKAQRACAHAIYRVIDEYYAEREEK